MTNPHWPYLRIVYVHLWPTILPLAGVCHDARTVGEALAREAMSGALGDSVAAALQASWLLVQSAFHRQLVFSVGGQGMPHLAHVTFADSFPAPRDERDSFRGMIDDQVSFTRCEDLPDSCVSEHAVAFCGGFLYVTNDVDHSYWEDTRRGPVDGDWEDNYRASFARYDFIRDEWQRCAPLPQESVPEGCEHPVGGALAEHAGRLYYSGGSAVHDIFDENGEELEFEVHELDTVYVFDADSNSWHLHSHMTTGRSGHGMISYAGSLWVFGGQEKTASDHPVAEVLGDDGQWRAFGSSYRSVSETLAADNEYTYNLEAMGGLNGCKLAVADDQLYAWSDIQTALFLYDKEEDTFELVGNVGPGGRGGIASIGGDRILLLAAGRIGDFWMEAGGTQLVERVASVPSMMEDGLQSWVEVASTPLVRAPIAFP